MCCPIMRIFRRAFAFFDWVLFGILRAPICSKVKKGALIRFEMNPKS